MAQSEVQRPVAMNPKLLEAARLGDKRILDDLLRPKDVSSGASLEEISIAVPEGAATQEDTSCLLGVTVGGNTALHIVAGQGHLDLAQEICQRERSLLAAQNKRLDTPLHCAARAGDYKMVAFLIQFAKEDGIEAERVLRARNQDKANALHEAAKYGHVRVAEVLMKEDARLACVQNSAGMSPLYLAIVMGSLDVAKALLPYSSEELLASQTFYAGPDNKTALHAAVLDSFAPPRHLGITELILKMKPTLVKCADSWKRIPLHYAAAASKDLFSILELLLKEDPTTAYQPDANGSFPIHMAASMGNVGMVDKILQHCPDTNELLDEEGRNFLHVAFQTKKLDMVKRIISQRPHLRKLLNDQDWKGNTPLHMAVKNVDQASVHFLLQDKSVYLNIMNHAGFTPIDLVYENMDEGLTNISAAKMWILLCLMLVRARFSQRTLRWADVLEKETEETIKRDQDLLKNIGVLSTLIATVTFSAGFTLPGGYIADDHSGRGTAVLAKEYAFKVFVISDAFALVSSIVATCCAIFGGSQVANGRYRKRAFWIAHLCIILAMIGMSSAFAMGIYAVLAPTCKTISILLCVIVLGCPFLATEVIFNWFYDTLTLIRSASVRGNNIVRLVVALVSILGILIVLVPILGIYALFFLIAMIKS